MDPSFHPAWRDTCLNTRAVWRLIAAGYDTPEKALADDPKRVIYLLRKGDGFGEKTLKLVTEFLYADYIHTPADINNFTDEQLIYTLKKRGYVVSRPI